MSAGKAAGGIGGIGIILAIGYALLTGDTSVLNQIQVGGGGGAPSKNEAEYREFAGVILADTEEVWTKEFSRNGKTYQAPQMVLFTGAVDSACGSASSAVGPFYCGLDRKVYLDLSFFDQMKERLGAKGDFAQAYVIAHEVGHHIQNVLGTLDKAHQQMSRMGKSQANEMSVRIELQADFLAGIWAHHAKDMASLDRQDIQEAMEAASAIGDDTLQKQSQGYVVPDAFTHGTSEQRMRWFMRGYESGDMNDGDTFNSRSL